LQEINWLTTPNPDFNDDKEMFDLLGLMPREAFRYEKEQNQIEV